MEQQQFSKKPDYPEPKYKLSWDVENKTVTLGDEVLTNFVGITGITFDKNKSRSKSEMSSFLAKFNKTFNITMSSKIDKHYNRNLNKRLCELFGPKITKRFHYAMYKVWIEPVPSNLRYLLYADFNPKKRAIYHRGHVEKIWERDGQIMQMVEDGQENLIPLLFYLGDALKIRSDDKDFIKKLISFMGKAEWKKACKSSRTKNLYVANAYLKMIMSSITYSNPSGKKYKTSFYSLRSGCLKQMGNFSYKTEFTAAKIAPTVKDFNYAKHIIFDTERMARYLGAPSVDYNWSYKRFLEEHDRLTKLIQQKTFSPEPFENEFSVDIEGYTFELLNSAYLIVEEGSIQGHCVGSYSDMCKKGLYKVFKVDGKERATLGVNVRRQLCTNPINTGETFLEFSQAYGKFNSRISPELDKVIGDFIYVYNKVLRDNPQPDRGAFLLEWEALLGERRKSEGRMDKLKLAS